MVIVVKFCGRSEKEEQIKAT